MAKKRNLSGRNQRRKKPPPLRPRASLHTRWPDRLLAPSSAGGPAALLLQAVAIASGTNVPTQGADRRIMVDDRIGLLCSTQLLTRMAFLAARPLAADRTASSARHSMAFAAIAAIAAVQAELALQRGNACLHRYPFSAAWRASCANNRSCGDSCSRVAGSTDSFESVRRSHVKRFLRPRRHRTPKSDTITLSGGAGDHLEGRLRVTVPAK